MTSWPMAEPILISIANLTIAVRTADTDLAARLRRRYSAFRGPASATPLLSVDLAVQPGARFAEAVPGPWLIDTTITSDALHFRTYTSQGAVDLRQGRGRLVMSANASIENFLRVLYAWLCLRHGALLLHAAGLIAAARGYVFFGPSGAGKTTATRLAGPEAVILSDDLVILRPEADGVHVYGVPFRGDLGSAAPRVNACAPVAGLYRLRQAPRHAVTDLPAATAVAELAAAAPFVNAQPALAQALMAICGAIAAAAPVHELAFRRDDGFWPLIAASAAPSAAPAVSDP